MQITMKPIGRIHSPYKTPKDMPIQGTFKPGIEAWVQLYKPYHPGLADLDGFSHAILLYYFHKSKTCRMTAQPFLEDQPHGIFAIRSPHRPNHIGLSIVKITRIEPGRLYFQEVDMLDKTPVLDIKPYVKYFDSRENTTAAGSKNTSPQHTPPAPYSKVERRRSRLDRLHRPHSRIVHTHCPALHAAVKTRARNEHLSLHAMIST